LTGNTMTYASGLAAFGTGRANWEAASESFVAVLVGPEYRPTPRHATLADIVDELRGAGYKRLPLTGRAVQLSDDAARVLFTANPVVWDDLASRERYRYVVVARQDGSGKDSESVLVSCMDLGEECVSLANLSEHGLRWGGSRDRGVVFALSAARV
jgi:hypothetical protein